MAHRAVAHKAIHRAAKHRPSTLAKVGALLAAPIPDVELLIGAMANPDSGIKFVLGIARKAGARVSEVQSVIFDKLKWTADAAKQWLQDHGFSPAGKDEGATFWRFRQQSPGKYKEFRTIVPGTQRNPVNAIIVPRRFRPYPFESGSEASEMIELREQASRILAVVVSALENSPYASQIPKYLSGALPSVGMQRVIDLALLDSDNVYWTPLYAGDPFVQRRPMHETIAQRRTKLMGNPTPSESISSYQEHLETTTSPEFRSATPGEQAAAMTAMDLRENPHISGWPMFELIWENEHGRQSVGHRFAPTEAQAETDARRIAAEASLGKGRVISVRRMSAQEEEAVRQGVKQNPYGSKSWEQLGYHLGHTRGGQDRAAIDANLHVSTDPGDIRKQADWHIDNQLALQSGYRESFRPHISSAFVNGWHDGYTRRKPRMKKPNPAYGQVKGRGWTQEWYETASGDARARTAQLRKLGYRVTASSMGSQVTPVGSVKMTLVDIRAGTSRDEELDNVPLPAGGVVRMNPSQFDFQRPDLGQVAFDAAKDFRLSGAYSETGVANARVAKYGFTKWWDNLPPLHRGPRPVRTNTKARLLKAWMEGWAAGKRVEKRNPESAAADLYEEFHGKPPGETLEIVTEKHEHEWLTQLGVLVELKIATLTNLEATIRFDKDAPQLCSSEDGRQLYIEGGDQSIDLKALKMDGAKWRKDSMALGVLVECTYQTEKGFQKFQLTDYYHRLGEETGVQPFVLYDPNNQLLSVSGGQYEVKPEGIVN